jgi:precorrin-2 dehydrogenase/sirohydrochlorin ferrochelatase
MLYPVFLDVRERKCVVVGGGHVAARKAEALFEAGACVTVISPDLCDDLKEHHASGTISFIRGEYTADILQGSFVVVAATDDMDVNRRINADCRARNIIINVVDVPELCDFHVPAIIRKGDITVAIGTGGKSPALSRHLRLLLQDSIGAEYGELLDILGQWRDTVKEKVPGQKRRHALWLKIIGSSVLDDLRAGRLDTAAQTVKELVEQEISHS